MPSILVKDSLRLAVEAASGGKITILYDDLGNPSYMRRFAPMTIKDLYRHYFADDAAWNASPFKAIENDVHPAFMKGGTRVKELLVGQYLASDLNGRACSLPGGAPRVYATYDNAVKLCKDKGPGWTLMTMHIWGFIQALCLRGKYQPRGNTNYGRSHEATWETALREDGGIPGVTSGTPRTRTGTGPASWSHDGTDNGVMDLVGDIWEWHTLMKLVDGKVMLASDNNIDLAESAWPDLGVRFDATTGSADGSGMAGDGHSGAPVISDTITKYSGEPGNNGYGYKYTHIAGEGGFRSMTKKSGYNVPAAMVLAGLAPITLLGGAYEDGMALKGAIWARNYGERLPVVGGYWDHGANAGLGALGLVNARSSSNHPLGLRPAFLLV